MANRALIAFHYPAPLAEVPGTGSQVRPVRILEAFAALDFDVVVIAGRARERRTKMRQLRRRVEGGDRLELCYGESSTMPTPLTEPHHLPTHPLLDARFFRWLHQIDVPAGIFYRDIYWRFPQYRASVPLSRRLPAIAAYRADLLWYRRTLDRLFLPSLRMRGAIPGGWPLDRSVALPPGGDLLDLGRQLRAPGTLRLFYVGGVTAPTYDIRPLLQARQAVPGVELTVCCPAGERDALDALGDLLVGVDVVHDTGPQLRQHYARADAACMVFAPEEYRSFAMPVKMFEAIGAGVPLIASSPSSAADFVAEHGFGWGVDGTEATAALLRRLVADPTEVGRVRATVLAGRCDHTWQARARQAAEALLGGGRDRRS